jgi:catechol 2,3-dioxygenase-like lactoylglutathione lyase family enzyme
VDVEHVDFISVPVSDMQRSIAWYRDTLGVPLSREGGFPEFKLGDNVYLYLIDPKSLGGEFTAPNTGPIALRVADVEAARAELESRGIEFLGETYDTGVCHMAPFDDPDGNRLMLHRRYAPVED